MADNNNPPQSFANVQPIIVLNANNIAPQLAAINATAQLSHVACTISLSVNWIRPSRISQWLQVESTYNDYRK